MIDPNSIISQRIFNLIAELKALGIVETDKQFCDSIGFENTRLFKIRDGKANFTAESLFRIHEVYSVDIHWIFGTSEKIFVPRKGNKKGNKI